MHQLPWPVAHPLPVTIVSITAAAAGFLMALALLAYRRHRDRRLLWIAGAFALFVAKATVTAIDLRTDRLGHEELEMFTSVVDLAILGCLIVPLFRRP